MVSLQDKTLKTILIAVIIAWLLSTVSIAIIMTSGVLTVPSEQRAQLSTGSSFIDSVIGPDTKTNVYFTTSNPTVITNIRFTAPEDGKVVLTASGTISTNAGKTAVRYGMGVTYTKFDLGYNLVGPWGGSLGGTFSSASYQSTYEVHKGQSYDFYLLGMQDPESTWNNGNTDAYVFPNTSSMTAVFYPN